MKVKPSIYCAVVALTEFLIYGERHRTSLCTESNLLVHASSALVMVTVQKFFFKPQNRAEIAKLLNES